MSRLSPFPSNMTFRTESRASVAASDTTYHTCAYQSFNDVELFAPSSPPSRAPAPVRSPLPHSATSPPQHHRQGRCSTSKEKEDPEPLEMRRQDSGYESLPPRSSFSNQRRTSTASSSQSSSQQHNSSSSSPSRPRGRPTIRRAPKTSPYPTAARTSGSSLYPSSRGHHASHAQPATFFHFPAHPTDLELANRAPRREDDRRGLLSPTQQQQPGEAECTEVSALPPQATHYWTSDRTRRLEYAAIDAASRGVKGWVKRNLVPDCFIPREKHVAFDDDTGSVRRYRLELDEETPEKGCEFGGRRRGWFGWRRSKTA
ncbi:hypothetical protein CPLU01_09081 [Colletotrichum plurivorum]|uniref:Uncharacterized protein n=1 Tax=Colletotrichum plurivorum TaxID=2175906 RepID=A0A8H6NBK8_9PEZI|nr:hypothetical protein CPLU01_09081 [Colletotrichum plurivorum]